jgi:ribonuclease HI
MRGIIELDNGKADKRDHDEIDLSWINAAAKNKRANKLAKDAAKREIEREWR